MVSMDLNGRTICIRIWVVLSLGWWYAVTAEENSEESHSPRGGDTSLHLLAITWLILFSRNMYTGPRVTTQRHNRPPDQLFQVLLRTSVPYETTRARNNKLAMPDQICTPTRLPFHSVFRYVPQCHILQDIWPTPLARFTATTGFSGGVVRVPHIFFHNGRCLLIVVECRSNGDTLITFISGS